MSDERPSRPGEAAEGRDRNANRELVELRARLIVARQQNRELADQLHWLRSGDLSPTARTRLDAERALRATEARYRELVQNANSAIIRWRADGTIVFFNEFAQAFFGYESDEVIGRHVDLLLPDHPSNGSDLGGLVERIVSNPEQFVNNVNENVCRDGRRVWFAWTNRAVFDEAGNVVEVLAVGSDITGQKLAEDALRELNRTLEQRVADRSALAEKRAEQLQALAVELIETEERERRQLAALLHDDLQQTLAGARLQLQAARRDLPPSPELESVERLLETSLDTSRRLSHELSPVVLQHSDLAAALQWLGQRFRERFDLEVEVIADGIVAFDSPPLKAFLFRAARELLFNVVKHAGVSSARLVYAHVEDRIALTVEDQGAGFELSVLEPADRPAGFGLLTLRERASYMGGGFSIESTPGQGTRVSLTLPLELVQAADAAAPAAAPTPELTAARQLAEPAQRADIRVLLVDDHRVMRQGLVGMISGRPGVSVIGEAADGRDGVEEARRLRPDVVIMDVSMPEMDGVEATRIIKAELPEVRVIGLSMYDDEQIVRAMRQAGAESFVTKSASSAELLEAIYGLARTTPPES